MGNITKICKTAIEYLMKKKEAAEGWYCALHMLLKNSVFLL